MSKSVKIKDRPQCIVLPFQPDSLQDFNGVGLALHFLLGNVMVLHTGLKECWFGWRVNKIFPEETDLNLNGISSEVIDLVYLVDYVFRGGPLPPDCLN